MEVLKKGTAVMIKVEGLGGKLEPKYHGRYFIEELTPGGNYRIKNALGSILKSSYPINKLKPIIEDNHKPEESVEVEKILNKRKNPETEEIEYLVKWKNLDTTENEWIKTTSMI